MENPDLVLQETGSSPTHSRLNYVPSGDTLRRDAISSSEGDTGSRFIKQTEPTWVCASSPAQSRWLIKMVNLCIGCIPQQA